MLSLDVVSQALLWIVVIVEGILLLALARQIGLLHQRLNVGGARIMNAGPKIGETVPALDAQDVNNEHVTLGIERGKRALLLFISIGCGTCETLLPQIKQLARLERDNLEIKLVVFGNADLENGQKYAQKHGLDSTLPLIVSNDLGVQYRVSIAPYGLVIDRSGILRAKGLVNSYHDIESLLNAEEMGVRSIDQFMQLQHEKQLN